MTSTLFTPTTLGGLALANRIVIAPMCQYSAEDGNASDWHTIHLGQLALSGAGLLLLEATAVEAAGRISPQDLGLYSDDNERALARVLDSVRRFGNTPLGVQLGHAGRKASSHRPWEGAGQVPRGQGGWQTVSASALPFSPADASPAALDGAGIARVRDAFVMAARRAVRLGLQAIELHAAHGYLIHQFLSPLSNQRNDGYGGDTAARCRFALEVFAAVREAVAPAIPVGVRISGTDWAEHGWDIEQSCELARRLEPLGCDFIHVSSGGLVPSQSIPVGPGYQVPLARAVREASRIPVIAVGLITEAAQAERILAEGQADLIAIARAALYDPRWPWHAAAELGATVAAPPQYLRSAPHGQANLFQTR